MVRPTVGLPAKDQETDQRTLSDHLSTAASCRVVSPIALVSATAHGWVEATVEMAIETEEIAVVVAAAAAMTVMMALAAKMEWKQQ